MQLEHLRFTYGLINGLILLTATFVSWHTYGLQRRVFFWLAMKAIAALCAIGLMRKWAILELDWILTTPLTVFILLLIAHYPQQMKNRFVWFPWIWCTLMSGGGILAEEHVWHLKWLWFGVSAISMGVIFWRLWMLQKVATHRRYIPLMRFNLLMWSLFPFVWLSGEHAFQWLSNAQSLSIFTFMDVLTKGGFFVLVVWLMREEIANDMEKGKCSSC